MQPTPKDSPESPRRSLKFYMHPVLWLFSLNVLAVVVLSPRWAVADIIFGLLLPLGFLWMLSGVLRTGTVSTNYGILTRSRRPVAFRVVVSLIVLAYAATSAGPFCEWTTSR